MIKWAKREIIYCSKKALTIVVSLIAALLISSAARAEENNNLINYRKKDLTPIQRAVVDGDLKKVKDLIKSDPELVKKRDQSNNTLLIYALQEEQFRITDYLITKGLDVNDLSFSGSPLGSSMKSDNPKIMKYLISKGADVNKRDLSGHTPLHRAAMYGKTEYAKYLLSKGADINAYNMVRETPLYAAIANGNLDTVKYLMSRRAVIGPSNGYKPLHIAAMAPNTDCVEYFLSQGEDPNCRDTNEDTPLHIFFGYGNSNLKIAELLVSAGADINAQNKNRITPAFYCLDALGNIPDHQKWFREILDMGVDVNHKDKSGRTLLSYSIGHDRDEFVKILLKRGSLTQIKDLVYLIKHKKTDMLLMLLQYGRRLQLIIGLIIIIILTGLFLIFRSKKTTTPVGAPSRRD